MSAPETITVLGAVCTRVDTTPSPWAAPVHRWKGQLGELVVLVREYKGRDTGQWRVCIRTMLSSLDGTIAASATGPTLLDASIALGERLAELHHVLRAAGEEALRLTSAELEVQP